MENLLLRLKVASLVRRTKTRPTVSPELPDGRRHATAPNAKGAATGQHINARVAGYADALFIRAQKSPRGGHNPVGDVLGSWLSMHFWELSASRLLP
jgi:hypothetical protein